MKILPRNNLILVRRYARPATHKGLHLPASYAVDRTTTLWEVVVASKRAQVELGCKLREGDVLKTRHFKAVDSGLQDGERRDLLFLQASDVFHVIKLVTEEAAGTFRAVKPSVTEEERDG